MAQRRQWRGGALAALVALTGCGRQEEAPATMPRLETHAEAESLGVGVADGTAVASPAPHRYDVYYTRGTTLYHRRFADGRWAAEQTVGSGVTSKPAAVSWGPGRVDVVARGSDNTLWHWWGNADALSGPESLGGALLYGPAIASRGVNQLQVFAIGTDHQLFLRSYGPTPGWSPSWTALGGYATSAPGAVSMSATATDVFVRGSDNALWHRGLRGTYWYGFDSLGGSLAGGPAVASTADGHLEVYVRNTALGISARTWSLAGWESWTTSPVAGGVGSDPSAVHAVGEPCDHLFFRQVDGVLGHRGCGDTNVVTLGALSSNPGSFETSTYSNDLLALFPPPFQVTLEGIWPRELFLLERFDTEVPPPGPFGGPWPFPPVVLDGSHRRYSTVPAWQHVSSGGLELGLDFGPFLANGAPPFTTKQARLIDHGACSIKTRWTKSIYDYPQQGYFPDPDGVGVIGGVFDSIYSGMYSQLMGDPTQPFYVDAVYPKSFFLEPTFLTPAGSTNLRANDDGFAIAFNFDLNVHTPDGIPDISATISGAANYRFFLDARGLLAIDTVGPVAGSLDMDLTGTLLSPIARLFKVDIQDSGDVKTALVGLPQSIRKAFLDELTPIAALSCNALAAPATTSQQCRDGAEFFLRTQLHNAMVARGMSETGATSLATDLAARTTAANFACLPVSDEPGEEGGRCTFHPAFRRVNVLPDGFELVVSESDGTNDNDAAILSWLSPDNYTACVNTYRAPQVSDRNLYRFDWSKWMAGGG